MLVAVSGGVLEVQPDKITVLADVAVRSTEMDQARAEAAKKAAETGVSEARDEKILWPKRTKHWQLPLPS